MSKKKILITGGAGFIGSHTAVALINAGYQPVIVDNFSNSEPKVIEAIEKITDSPIKCYSLDCCNPENLQLLIKNEGHFDGIIHFAAFKAVGESVKEPIKYYKNNLSSLWEIISMMDQSNTTKIVFSSSCTVYGQPDTLPVTESSPIKEAESPYASTKQMGEQILIDRVKKGGIQGVLLRYFNPIGAHPSGLIGELPQGIPNNLMPFITQTAKGLRKELSIFGDDYDTPDGTCIRDYIHVMDLAEAHVKALQYMEENPNVHIDHFNVGTGNGYSVMECLQAFEAANDVKVPYSVAPKRAGDITKIWADTEKVEKQLNWKAKRSLSEAMRDAWNWEKKLDTPSH